MARTEYVHVEDNGSMTLPAAMRERLGLRNGDAVALIETDDGVLITSRRQAAVQALDLMGDALGQGGVPLEDMIEAGREDRGHILDEMHGSQSSTA